VQKLCSRLNSFSDKNTLALFCCKLWVFHVTENILFSKSRKSLWILIDPISSLWRKNYTLQSLRPAISSRHCWVVKGAKSSSSFDRPPEVEMTVIQDKDDPLLSWLNYSTISLLDARKLIQGSQRFVTFRTREYLCFTTFRNYGLQQAASSSHGWIYRLDVSSVTPEPCGGDVMRE
jgi:hypothetical protein